MGNLLAKVKDLFTPKRKLIVKTENKSIRTHAKGCCCSNCESQCIIVYDEDNNSIDISDNDIAVT